MARILIADDSASIRLLLVRTLAGDGHDVVQAADGLSAYRLLTTKPFDVAVLDVMMPALDGLTLCRMLRDAQGLGHLAVIIVSADASEIAALTSGADAFFSKPFSPTSLRVAVTRLAGDRQAEGHRARQPPGVPFGSPSAGPDTPAAVPASGPMDALRGETDRPTMSMAPADALGSRSEV